MTEARWVEWRPPWAPHVVGRYTLREVDGETGEAEPQKVEVRCEHAVCANHPPWRTECRSGAVREHVARYAAQHLHADPFGGKRKK